MQATPGLPERARWEVLFVHKGTIKRKRFGDDLASALSFHNEVLVRLGKNARTRLWLTLRCTNLRWPPPPKLRPYERTVRLKGKRKPVTVLVIPMRKLNRQGIWWCGYCMKLRRFVERTMMGETQHCCPMCGASARLVAHRDYNPLGWKVGAE